MDLDDELREIRKESCVHSALSCRQRGNQQHRTRRAGLSRIPPKYELNVAATSERRQLISSIIYRVDKHIDYAADMNVKLFEERT